METKIKIADITENDVVAYFDLEFCNERISRHNVPIAIGISYYQAGREIGNYYSLIWFGEKADLWREQLYQIGYDTKLLRQYGKYMEEVTEEILLSHETYHPKLYISFGKQDEDLLKKHVTRELSGWNFSDAIKYLQGQLDMKYDISLEKYAYICGVDFIHDFDPLEDARSLADIVWCALKNNVDEEKRREVAEEYDRKIFLTQYENKQQAFQYLSALSEPTLKQKEKLKSHGDYLKKNQSKYLRIYKEH